MRALGVWFLVVVGAGYRPDDRTSSNDDTACVPGAQQHCGCVGGAVGAQTCKSDGTGFEPCMGCDSSSSSAAGSGTSGVSSGGSGVSAPGTLSGDGAFDVGSVMRFTTTGRDGGRSLGVFLIDDPAYCPGMDVAGPLQIVTIMVDSDPPPLGTYAVATDAGAGPAIVERYDQDPDAGIAWESFRFSTGGTVTLDRVGFNSAAGSFDVEMRSYYGGGGGRLSGTFDQQRPCW